MPTNDPEHPEPRPILDQQGRDVGSMSHPMDAADAHAMAWAHEDNDDHSVVLMPTLNDVIAADRDPERTLAAMRTLTHSVWAALSKAIRSDLDAQDANGSAMSTSAVAIENAMVDIYGPEPRSLARIFVQSVIDEVLDTLLPTDDEMADTPWAEPTRDRTYIPPDTEPALPVQDTITPSGRGPGYHPGSVAQAIGRDVTAAIASLETGATVAADVDFSTVVGVRPDPGEHVQITLPVRLDITGVAR